MNNKARVQGNLLKVFTKAWQGIDFFRKLILNLVFFALFFYLINLIACQGPTVPGSAVLVLAPQGTIVEQLSPVKINPLDPLPNLGEQETLLKDLLDALKAGQEDTRIKMVLLKLDGLGSAGLTKLQDLAAALDNFKKSGKKVIATADNYNRNSYYLAAHANEIYMHQMGLLTLEGYSRYRQFYKEGLDKLEVDVNIFRVGKYKSFVEPYMRNNMSDEDKESSTRWLGVLWDTYLTDVAKARKIKVEVLKDYIDKFNEHLEENRGQTALMAKNAGLIDYAGPRDLLTQRLIGQVGEDEDTHSFNQISYTDYLEALNLDQWGDNESGQVIGVIVASGNILDGYQPPGTIGGDSTAELIREARKDKNVKAILLRVDSGGGSAFASEVIRRELELAQKDGKPVVISMSSVAASGGYEISLAANQVWAYPTTITGSIGILGIFPTFQKTLKKYLGIQVDGVGTNKWAGALRFDREMSPELKETIQRVINSGYDDFINRVAKARNMTPAQVDEIAQGRVWIGSDAYNLGLVDRLGGLNDALDSAAQLAKLKKPYKIKYFRKKTTLWNDLLYQLWGKVLARKNPGNRQLHSPNPLTRSLRTAVKQIKRFAQFNDPQGIYAIWTDDVDF